MITGYLDHVESSAIGGWAFDRQCPDAAPSVRILIGETLLAEVPANIRRDDLVRAAIGTGAHGFTARPARPLTAHELTLVKALVIDSNGAECPLPRWNANNPSQQPEADPAQVQINYRNMPDMLSKPPRHFDLVLFDPNNDCNVQCVYCHNLRSKSLVEDAAFSRLLSTAILGTRNFQFGCAMEPTLDPRLADMMLMVANSPAKPRDTFRLQTNAILLHRHDTGKLRESGLTTLTVSIDSIDPDAFARLRGGTSLPKVLRNLLDFRTACPEVTVMFVTTVTSLNIHTIDALIGYGLDIGVQHFNLRQVFYYPRNRLVDHAQMPGLLVSDAAFQDMTQHVTEKYAGRARFHVQASSVIVAKSKEVLAASSLALAQARLKHIVEHG